MKCTKFKSIGVLLLLLFAAGCSSLATVDLKPTDAAVTTAPPTQMAKVKQWFTPDTPETLPKDKLDKMNLSGGGFGGAY